MTNDNDDKFFPISRRDQFAVGFGNGIDTGFSRDYTFADLRLGDRFRHNSESLDSRFSYISVDEKLTARVAGILGNTPPGLSVTSSEPVSIASLDEGVRDAYIEGAVDYLVANKPIAMGAVGLSSAEDAAALLRTDEGLVGYVAGLRSVPLDRLAEPSVDEPFPDYTFEFTQDVPEVSENRMKGYRLGQAVVLSGLLGQTKQHLTSGSRNDQYGFLEEFSQPGALSGITSKREDLGEFLIKKYNKENK